MILLENGSLRSRSKRGGGRGARTREKNGELGLLSPSPFTPATQAKKNGGYKENYLISSLYISYASKDC